MSVLRMGYPQGFCGTINCLTGDPLVLKMGISIREAAPLRLLLGGREFALA